MIEEQKSVMVAVNAPYAQMIVNGYMDFIFKDDVLNDLYVGVHNQPRKLYIYETTNRNGIGRVVGHVLFDTMYCPLYKSEGLYTTARTESRFALIKKMYYDWCIRKNLKPNPNEGWFKSEKFKTYQEEIGFCNDLPNYALHITHPIPYLEPIDITTFKTENEEVVLKTLENMCILNT